MTAEENKTLVRQMIHEVWTEEDASAIDRFAEGDEVAVRLMVSGTHDRGPFGQQPPSGRRLAWASFRFFRLAEGQIVETWAMQDRLGLMQQLGAVPSAGANIHWAGEETSG
jgi:hypothetical protein